MFLVRLQISVQHIFKKFQAICLWGAHVVGLFYNVKLPGRWLFDSHTMELIISKTPHNSWVIMCLQGLQQLHSSKLFDPDDPDVLEIVPSHHHQWTFVFSWDHEDPSFGFRQSCSGDTWNGWNVGGVLLGRSIFCASPTPMTCARWIQIDG
jgi:hypothetical protein